jgi:hypothetical protein
VQRVRTEIDQETAEHEFRRVAEQGRGKGQHRCRNRRRGQGGGKPTGAAGVEVEHRAADRDAAGIAAEGSRQHVGDARDVQLALEIGLAMDGDLDAGGIEQRAGSVTKMTAIRLPARSGSAYQG